VNVPELTEKVKRGVVGVYPLDVTSPVPAEGGAFGSGFIIDQEGHLITNAHVGGQASVAQIVFWDGSSARASLVAAAPYYDIALLKLDNPDPAKLFPVPLGDSEAVQPGELALAIGCPGSLEGFNIDRSNPFEYFGLRQTLTMRVVTGRDSDLAFEMSWYYRNRFLGTAEYGLSYAMHLPYVFRTQVPINSGNSGGPLFNRNGEVIAVNTWGLSAAAAPYLKIQQSNSSVPINFAKNFVVEVLEHRRHDIPWLGIHCIFPPSIQDPDSYIEFRERIRPQGLWIFEVDPDSPAAQAGLAKGDQILRVNGQEPPRPEAFRTQVLLGEIGEDYLLAVRRGEREFAVHLYSIPKPRYVVNFSV